MTFDQCVVGHVGHVGPAELSFGAFLLLWLSESKTGGPPTRESFSQSCLGNLVQTRDHVRPALVFR